MVGDPTPEEIRIRAAEIRAEWDERTEKQRRVGYDNSPVTVHVVSVNMGKFVEEPQGY